jgi:hypothetical protein
VTRPGTDTNKFPKEDESMSNDQPIQWPEKMTMEEKLQRLQITAGDLEFYASKFVQDRSCFFINEGQGLKEAKIPNGKSLRLTNHIIAYHLLGKYEVAIVAPDKIRQCCLIVQYVREFQYVYERITTHLRTPLVFFDRETSSLHYYVHFDFSIHTEKLFRIMSWELDRIGISPHLIYKIFPHHPEFLRLPLGRDSFLIEPQSLKIACKGPDAKVGIEFIRQNLIRRSFKDLFPSVKHLASR